MWTDMACRALREGQVLELRYDGFARLVEVHAVGWTKDGHAVMRAWQTGGGSVSGERIGWKLMRLDEAAGAVLSEERSEAPRPGYRRGDRHLSRIICEV